MSDEDKPVLAGDPESRDRELLLYDFFKHMTSLVLLTLGGVLVIAQGADKSDVNPIVLGVVLVLISAAGVCSFTGSSEIVKARYTDKPSRFLEFYRKGAPVLLSFGVGMFLAIFVDSLS